MCSEMFATLETFQQSQYEYESFERVKYVCIHEDALDEFKIASTNSLNFFQETCAGERKNCGCSQPNYVGYLVSGYIYIYINEMKYSRS